jgi:hypothetical protein
MVPVGYHDFFSGCATVAGALIGLLFVAISVSPEKLAGDRASADHQVKAESAHGAEGTQGGEGGDAGRTEPDAGAG